MRRLVFISSVVLASACTLEPQLAPTAMGCYRLDADAIPTLYQQDLIPSPPTFVRLDTALGGQAQVPAEWLEAGPYRTRYAQLVLVRPAVMLIDGVPVAQSKPNRQLPPDSLGLVFGQGNGMGRLVAYLARQSTGEWQGQAELQSPRAPGVTHSVPVRLSPTTCGSSRLAISR